MKINLKKKSFWKKVLIALGIGLSLVIAIASLVKVNNSQTTRKLGVFDYSLGTISTTTGKVSTSSKHIVTDCFCSVDGMKIELSDDASVSYKVFFYDSDKEFIDATASKQGDFEESDIEELSLSSTAKYFKVEITPAQVDGEDVSVSILTKHTYTNQLSISFNK